MRERDLLAHGDEFDAALAHGLIGLVRALAIEGAKPGWTINALAVAEDTGADERARGSSGWPTPRARAEPSCGSAAAISARSPYDRGAPWSRAPPARSAAAAASCRAPTGARGPLVAVASASTSGVARVAADAVVADLTDPAGCAAVADALRARGWTPSVLVNNAGINRDARAESMTDEDFARSCASTSWPRRGWRMRCGR